MATWRLATGSHWHRKHSLVSNMWTDGSAEFAKLEVRFKALGSKEAGRQRDPDEGLAQLTLPEAQKFAGGLGPAVDELMARHASSGQAAPLAVLRDFLREQENRLAGWPLDTKVTLPPCTGSTHLRSTHLQKNPPAKLPHAQNPPAHHPPSLDTRHVHHPPSPRRAAHTRWQSGGWAWCCSIAAARLWGPFCSAWPLSCCQTTAGLTPVSNLGMLRPAELQLQPRQKHP